MKEPYGMDLIIPLVTPGILSRLEITTEVLSRPSLGNLLWIFLSTFVLVYMEQTSF